MSHDKLVDWVWHTAIRDRILGESLRCEAAHAAAGGLDPAALRESIARLTEIHPDTTWRQRAAAGEQVEAAVDLLRRAVERRTSRDLVAICEFALQRAEQAIMDGQDSEYWSNGGPKGILRSGSKRRSPGLSPPLWPRLANISRRSLCAWSSAKPNDVIY